MEEVNFQDQREIYQELKVWVSPRGSQTSHGLFYDEEKQEFTHIEGFSPEEETINNQAPEESISTNTIVLVK